MGIAISMVVITVGAIMRFAVSAQGRGFNVQTTGMILMVVGVIGALLSIGFWASWGGFGGVTRRGTVTGVQASIVSAPPVVVSPPPVVVSGPRTIVRETEVL